MKEKSSTLKHLIFFLFAFFLLACDDSGANSSGCGDGVVDPGEACDGADLGGTTCEGLHYYGGTLSCTSDCQFSVASCEVAGWCGDGVKNGPEDCDTHDTGSETCTTLDHGDGELGCTSECLFDISTCNDPDLFLMSDLTFAGAFRFTNGDFGISSVNYAIGTLAYNPQNHSLFIAGHDHQRAVAEYPISGVGMQSTVEELPETGEPIQGFVSVLDALENPQGLDRITGMFWVNGSLIVNAEQWYDAPGDNLDTTLVIADANDLGGMSQGFFELEGAAHSAGYMGPIPAALGDEFGADYYTGWSSVYSIVSRYSVGPSLWTLDPTALLTGDAEIG
ncbi:hypothetical protein KJ865_02060, partial [Myxococcota bacterium]|nr:hypothetical protein [Myxococcota bacterium]